LTATVTQMVPNLRRAEVTWWPSLLNTQGYRETANWSDVFDQLSKPQAFLGESHPGWSAAVFHGDKRSRENVERVTAAVFDYDKGTSLDEGRQQWEGYYGLLHTTKSHTLDTPRFRIVLPLSRPVSAFEWDALWRRFQAHTGGALDGQAKDPSRFWYQSGIGVADGAFIARRMGGKVLDVDEWLSKPEPVTEKPRPVERRQYEPASLEYRASRYIARMPEAISGSGGHNATWQVAVALARGFGLSESQTLAILWNEYNPRCQPQWSEKELRHKARQAVNANVPSGYLLDQDREWTPTVPSWEPPDDAEPGDYSDGVCDMGDGEPEPNTAETESPKPVTTKVCVYSMRDMFEALATRVAAGKSEQGISTCDPKLDFLLGGLRRGRVTTFGARTSFGKTSYSIMVTDEAMLIGEPVIVVSCEDTQDMFAQRYMARRARINAARLRINQLRPDEVIRLNEQTAASTPVPFFINAVGMTVEEAAKRVRALAKDVKPKLIVFDYLQRCGTRQNLDPKNRVTRVMEVMGDAIKEVDAAGLIISQFSRPEKGNPDKEPTMFDLKESGDVENMSEHILLGWAPEEQDSHGNTQRVRKVKVEKNKDGPMPDMSDPPVMFEFDKPTASFKVNRGEYYGSPSDEFAPDGFEDYA
jgi:KaiC/GvpD/RAD55 family RecA-like ATPase